MAAPLKVGSSSDCGSLKSRNQPTFGQMSHPDPGTLQNRVYSVSCGTLRKLRLKPSCCSWPCATVAVCRPGSALAAIARRVPLGVAHPVELVEALLAAGLLEAAHARRDVALGDRPDLLAAAGEQQRLAVEGRHDRLADVEVVARLAV